MQLLYALVVMIISYAIQSFTAPRINNAPVQQMGDVPTASEGDPIPVVFGTVTLKQPNIIWYGDPSTSPIRSQSGKK